MEQMGHPQDGGLPGSAYGAMGSPVSQQQMEHTDQSQTQQLYSPQGAPTGSFVRDVGDPGPGAYSAMAPGQDEQYHQGGGMDHRYAATDFRTDCADSYHGEGSPLGAPRPCTGESTMRGSPDGQGASSSEPSHGGKGGSVQGSDGTGGHSSPPPRAREAPMGENRNSAADSAAAVGQGGYHDMAADLGVPCGVAAGESQFGPRSGIDKYLQWLDAIHTACSKLDDLCSKLDRNFPNATREWDATSAGIRGARQLFQLYGDSHPLQQQQQGGPQDEVYNINPRKRPRRDHANAVGGPGGLQGSQASSGSLAHDFAGAALGMGRAPQQHGMGAPTGALASMGLGGAYGNPVVDSQGKPVGGAHTLSVPLTQHCGPPLPGTANVLPPAGVPTSPAIGDGGEYEYLLDYPEQEAPDPDNPNDLKCDVAGVYWDKRSWIASWYEGGKRYYKSFSAKTHGFYRSKYWAIKVRLSKVQSHALAGKGCKARAAAA